MSAQVKHTHLAILEAGRKEFLEYGYEGASLRRIAREASVTTGAIYGYFPGKEALFVALTGEAADGLLEKYRQVHDEFAGLPPSEQAASLDHITDETIPWMINYIYDQFDIYSSCCFVRAVREAVTAISHNWSRWKRNPVGILSKS